MDAPLTLSREHLGDNRRMIIGRSLAASIAGLIPIPVFEDWLAFTVQRRTLQRIADSRQVDADDEALKNLAYGEEQPPQWHEMTATALVYRIITRTWRKLMLVYLAARRAQVAASYFQVATLFDHYCARLHVGLGLDAGEALVLRRLMDRAIAETPGSLGGGAFRRGLSAAVRATARAPLELADIATGGAVRKLLRKGSEVEAAEEVDTALERQLAGHKTFLSRATTAIELQLSAEANPYIDRLVDNFERLWRAHDAADDTPDGTK